MQLNFKIDFKPLANAFLSEAPKQLPFASARTLTMLANETRLAIERDMPLVFDRPTDFSIKALQSIRADKTNQVASVLFKQSQAAAGKSMNEHMRPGVDGAPARAQKKTEFLLTKLGDLPPGWVTVPGNKMPLDSYGNLAGSYYKQIINVLQLKVNTRYASGRAVSKASQKRAVRLGVANELFAVAPGHNTKAKGGGWLPPGVYKHLPGKKLLQMLKFVKKASYTPRLDMVQIAKDTIATRAVPLFEDSVVKALDTALSGKK